METVGSDALRGVPVAAGLEAPYVTAWSEEVVPPAPMVVVPVLGIAYADEQPADRDRHGRLWLRARSRQGDGHPLFAMTHPGRQRRAMVNLRCQVCAGPADRTYDGVLWLLPDHRDDWPDWPERMGATEPPICLACVEPATRRCPALRRGAVAIRARNYPIAGVHGFLFAADHGEPTAVDVVTAPLDNPIVPMVQVMSLARSLTDCRIIEIDDLLSPHRPDT